MTRLTTAEVAAQSGYTAGHIQKLRVQGRMPAPDGKQPNKSPTGAGFAAYYWEEETIRPWLDAVKELRGRKPSPSTDDDLWRDIYARTIAALVNSPDFDSEEGVCAAAAVQADAALEFLTDRAREGLAQTTGRVTGKPNPTSSLAAEAMEELQGLSNCGAA